MIRALILLVLVSFSASAADDLADARAAFNTLITYQKTDDIRSLDLFATQCLFMFKVMDGTNEQTVIIPPDVYRAALKNEIAQKRGSHCDYENVTFSSDGLMVKVNAVVHYTDSGKKGPFSAIYERDDNGIMKIEEIRATVFHLEPTP